EEDAFGDDTLVRVDEVSGTEELFVNAGAAEDGEPEEADDRGHQQDTGDELADRASAGDAGDEDTDERRPGDPPAPVEQGPRRIPLRTVGTRIGTDVEGHVEHGPEPDGEGFDEVREREERRPEHEHGDEQDSAHREVDVRQPLDARTHARDHRGGGEEGDDDDEDDEERVVVVADDADVLEPGRDLLYAEAQRGGDAEDGAEDRDDIDEVTGPAFDLVAQQRFERPADRQRASAAVDGVGQGHAEHGVEGPGVQTPVDESLGHAHLRVLDLTAGPARFRPGSRIGQRLSDSVEDQSDAHSCGEEHREPRQDPELRFVIVLAELDPAELGESDDDREGDEETDDEHVVPAEVGDDPVLDARDDVARPLGDRDREDDDTDDDDESGPEDARGDQPLAEVHALAAQFLGDRLIGIAL